MKVDTDVPYGNAAEVRVTEGSPVTTVEFMPSPGGGTETMWFCFRLKKTDTDCRQVRLVNNNFQNSLGGGTAERCRIVVRYDGADWQRTEAGVSEVLPDGRINAIWTIDAPKTWVDVAWCYPYGVAELDALIADTNGYWKRDTIGLSQGGRPLYRISNSYGELKSDRPGLYLISRQHASETSGGWVLDGFLRRIAAAGDSAPLVWAVPLANIDDIEEGHYGKDPHPIDVNRAWGTMTMRHENHVIQGEVWHRWRPRCKPALTIDFHSPAACEDEGVYMFSPPPEEFPEYHAAIMKWAPPIEKHLAEYVFPGLVRIARYPSRWDGATFSRNSWAMLGICGLTFETPYATIRKEIVLTREHYQEIGSRIAEGVLEHLQQY